MYKSLCKHEKQKNRYKTSKEGGGKKTCSMGVRIDGRERDQKDQTEKDVEKFLIG